MTAADRKEKNVDLGFYAAFTICMVLGIVWIALNASPVDHYIYLGRRYLSAYFSGAHDMNGYAGMWLSRIWISGIVILIAGTAAVHMDTRKGTKKAAIFCLGSIAAGAIMMFINEIGYTDATRNIPGILLSMTGTAAAILSVAYFFFFRPLGDFLKNRGERN